LRNTTTSVSDGWEVLLMSTLRDKTLKDLLKGQRYLVVKF